MVTYETVVALVRDAGLIQETSKDDERRTLTVFNENRELTVDLSFSRGVLTEVYFLNNQFYELNDEELLHCFEDIIKGQYSVRKSLFSNKKWIVTDQGKFTPARTTDKSFDFKVYETLPKKFGV